MSKRVQNNSQQTQLIGINYLVPNAICKLLASGTILVNLYWAKNQQVQLMGMSIATLFCFVFGYLIIISWNLTLAFQIGRRRHDSPVNIGIYYQRALVINFIISAFIITPILYISNKIVTLFVNVDESMSAIIGQYLFQLVPSIYCFVFYDTTQTFLLAQGHFLAALIVNIFGFFCHFYLINELGAAWSKNFTDFGRCIGIYLHLALNSQSYESWIQWTIQCFKGWQIHLKIYKNIGISTYLQSIFLFVFTALGYNLPRTQLICHISFVNIVLIVFIVNVGLKQGLIIKLSELIKKKKIRYSHYIGFRSLKIFFAVSLVFVFMMLIYISEICQLFLAGTVHREVFMQKYWVMLISIIADSLSMSLLTLIKIFNKDYPLIRQLSFLISSCILAYFVCYKLNFGLLGLWYSWIIMNTIHTVFNWFVLIKNQNLNYNKTKNSYQPLLQCTSKEINDNI